MPKEKWRCEQCGATFDEWIADAPKIGRDRCPACDGNEFEKRLPKTNREMLRDLVEDGDEMTLVFMRERLQTICQPYLTLPKEDLRAQFGVTGIFAPGMADIYIAAAKVVNEGLDDPYWKNVEGQREAA